MPLSKAIHNRSLGTVRLAYSAETILRRRAVNGYRRSATWRQTPSVERATQCPVRVVPLNKGRLYAVHLREHAAVSRDPQPPETVVGEGTLDLKALCRAMRDVGFSGPLSLEMYYNRQAPLEPLQRSLANLAEAAQATA